MYMGVHTQKHMHIDTHCRKNIMRPPANFFKLEMRRDLNSRDN